MSRTRVVLDESEIPTHWYNIVADLKNPPLPPLGGDGNPVSPDQMLAIFPGPVLEQEMSAERWIAIPEEVRQIYALWRPSPLCRATRLEQMLGTPAKIFYKYEGVSPGRFAQAKLGRAAGLPEQDRGHQAPDHRDRRRPVGLVPVLRRPVLRPAGRGLHGQGQLQPEALSPPDDADLGRRRGGQPVQSHQDRPRHPRRRSRTTRAAWASRFPRQSRRW
jgi:hypothetical protein